MNERTAEERIVKYASALLEAPALSRLDDARRRFVTRTERPRRAPGFVRVSGVLAFACVLLLLFDVAHHRTASPRPTAAARPATNESLTFTVDGASGAPDVAISLDRPTSLRFSEGTRIVLTPRSRARVTGLTPSGATLVLEEGSATLDVVHRDSTSFHVRAGPYDVRITGTRFDATWDPKRGALMVAMREGRVVVTGCGDIAEVANTEKIERRCAAGAASDEAPTPVLGSPHDLPSAPSSGSARLAASQVPRAATTGAIAEQTRARSTWFRAGDAARVYASVENRFEEACSEATTPHDLWVLAESARRTRHLASARHGWAELARRFPGSAEAETSAFVLGRLADDAGDLAAARVWFERAASSGPSALRREALGRWMTTTAAAGDRKAAARLARDYLRTFPDGPYAERARSLDRGGE